MKIALDYKKIAKDLSNDDMVVYNQKGKKELYARKNVKPTRTQQNTKIGKLTKHLSLLYKELDSQQILSLDSFRKGYEYRNNFVAFLVLMYKYHRLNSNIELLELTSNDIDDMWLDIILTI